MNKQLLTVNLIKSQITDSNIIDTQNISFEGLYKFAQFHSVANIVGKAIFEIGLADKCENKDEFYAEQLKAMMDYQRQQYDLGRIHEVFEKEQICYVALKGAVIKDLYPEPEMRTSCDIDVLVRAEDIERASKALEQNLGAQYMCRSAHDVSYMTDSGVHIELHHTLCEDNYIGSSLLSRAWDYTIGDGCEKQFTNEFFVYYHYAHMAKHLVDGGFGIRLISDLYLINKKMEFDKAKLDEILMQGTLKTFADKATELSLVWFEEKPHTEAAKMLEEYIFESGIFGTLEHGVAVRESSGGLKSSLFKRLFISKDRLAGEYPGLKNKPYLYPWYSLVRIAKSGFSKTKTELQLISSVDKQKKDAVGKMLKSLDINID